MTSITHRVLVPIVVVICMTAGFLGESKVNAFCEFGGDCFDSTPPDCNPSYLCGTDTYYYEYYDPSCSVSNVCCQGPVFCKDAYPSGPCWQCGSTDHAFCWYYPPCPNQHIG